MKYCSKCGAELQDDYKFCPSCKEPVEESITEEVKEAEETVLEQDEFAETTQLDAIKVDSKTLVFGIIGMSCGIASLVLFWFGFLLMGFFPIALGVAGLVFSILAKKNGEEKKSKVGIITSIIGLVLSIIASIILLALGGFLNITQNTKPEETTTTIEETTVATTVETTTEATTEETTETTVATTEKKTDPATTIKPTQKTTEEPQTYSVDDTDDDVVYDDDDPSIPGADPLPMDNDDI